MPLKLALKVVRDFKCSTVIVLVELFFNYLKTALFRFASGMVIVDELS